MMNQSISQTYARPLRSLISSSQASSSHQGITTMFLLSKVGTTSSQQVTSFTRDWYVSFALLNISFWMVVRRPDTVDPISARGMAFLTPLSRRTEMVCFLPKSWGPISNRSGTPYNIVNSLSQKSQNGTNLLFPIIELIAWGISFTQISFSSNPRLLQSLCQFLTSPVDIPPLFIRCLRRNPTRNNNSLNTSDARWKNQSLIIAMDHDHNTNRTRGQSPRVLPYEWFGTIDRIFDEYVKHLRTGKVLTKAMRGGCLNTTSRSRDETFQRRRV